MIISIINNTNLSRFEIQNVLRAVNRQLQEDFRRYWHKDVELRLEGWTGEVADPEYPLDMRGDAVIYLWDGHDVDNALGYHDINYSGVPYGFVFTELSKQLGEPWSVTLSHEALEMAIDPEVNLYASGPHPQDSSTEVLHWYELCDAVQSQTYEIDDVTVSNFLLPLYFTIHDEHHNHNDFLGSSLPSFGIAPGGYVGYLDPQTGQTEFYSIPEDDQAQERMKKIARFGGDKWIARHERSGVLPSDSKSNQAPCIAISFELRQESISNTDQVYPLAKEIAISILGEDWTVIPCNTDEFEFDAEYRGRSPARFSEAWDLVYHFESNTSVLWAEPSFSTPIPGEFEDITVQPRTGKRAASSQQRNHKPGTEQREWSLKQCRVQEAWQYTLNTTGRNPGQDIRIGHPDSGYLHHTQLDDDRLLTGIDYDFLGGDNETQDDTGSHGLATGSVIMSGVDRVGEYVTGTAPFASLLPMRVTQPGLLPAPVLLGAGMHRLRNAIDHAIANQCDVISISLGGLASRAVEKAVRRAKEQGVIVLAAAGNEVRLVVWPARYDDVIAVAASNIERSDWSRSCRGNAVDITAPGESVWCARKQDNTDSTERGNGTSFAVAIVAGIAAVWISHHGKKALIDRYGAPNISKVFRTILKATASTENNLPNGFGEGIVDALALLKAELPESEDIQRLKQETDETTLDDAIREQDLGISLTQLNSLTSSNKREILAASLLSQLTSKATKQRVEKPVNRKLSRNLRDQLIVNQVHVDI